MELIEKVLIPCGDANFDLRDIASAAYWLLGSHLPALMKTEKEGRRSIQQADELDHLRSAVFHSLRPVGPHTGPSSLLMKSRGALDRTAQQPPTTVYRLLREAWI